MSATERMNEAETLEEASKWALISIAESLASLVEYGIETYQLDGDGHRK